MVRIIAGTLIYVGKGKIQPEEIPEIIKSKDRVRAGITAAAKGLTLTYVSYDDQNRLTFFRTLFR